MARKLKSKPKSKAKSKAKSAKKPTASATRPGSGQSDNRRIVETTTFQRGKTGELFHMALKTKPVGKIITASVGGRVKSIAISR